MTRADHQLLEALGVTTEELTESTKYQQALELGLAGNYDTGKRGERQRFFADVAAAGITSSEMTLAPVWAALKAKASSKPVAAAKPAASSKPVTPKPPAAPSVFAKHAASLAAVVKDLEEARSRLAKLGADIEADYNKVKPAVVNNIDNPKEYALFIAAANVKGPVRLDEQIGYLKEAVATLKAS